MNLFLNFKLFCLFLIATFILYSNCTLQKEDSKKYTITDNPREINDLEVFNKVLRDLGQDQPLKTQFYAPQYKMKIGPDGPYQMRYDTAYIMSNPHYLVLAINGVNEIFSKFEFPLEYKDGRLREPFIAYSLYKFPWVRPNKWRILITDEYSIWECMEDKVGGVNPLKIEIKHVK